MPKIRSLFRLLLPLGWVMLLIPINRIGLKISRGILWVILANSVGTSSVMVVISTSLRALQSRPGR